MKLGAVGSRRERRSEPARCSQGRADSDHRHLIVCARVRRFAVLAPRQIGDALLHPGHSDELLGSAPELDD